MIGILDDTLQRGELRVASHCRRRHVGPVEDEDRGLRELLRLLCREKVGYTERLTCLFGETTEPFLADAQMVFACLPASQRISFVTSGLLVNTTARSPPPTTGLPYCGSMDGKSKKS